jgi:uncharacterized protein YuzB (UPF0349 family)
MPEQDLQVKEIKEFLELVETFAPKRERDSRPESVVFRNVEGEEIIDDTVVDEELDETEESQDVDDNTQETEEDPSQNDVIDYETSTKCPVCAVDCGIVRLGETENGLVIALRASIVKDEDGKSNVLLYRSGPIYLNNKHKAEIFYQIGQQLLKPNIFVELDESDPDNVKIIKIKKGVADNANQYSDRFRNWFERILQKVAVESVENGIILVDGALTKNTRDTPTIFLQHLADLASSKGNAIIAISKKSSLLIEERPIQFWLDDVKNKPCYRDISALMRREKRERVLGNTYVARFSNLGPTFRMDVKSASGQSDKEAIDLFYTNAFLKGGYPDILVRAHSYSYFTPPVVTELQAQTRVLYKLIPKSEVDLSSIFAPFGGRFK